MQSVLTMPYEALNPILREATTKTSDIGVYRSVCKSFQQTVDETQFLSSLLVKLKGRSFCLPDQPNYPENFFVLEKDITQAFKTMLTEMHEMPHADHFKISEIAIKDFASRVFTLRLEDETVFYRFSENDLNPVQQVSCKNKAAWQDFIKTLAKKITEYDFPMQIKLYYPTNIPYLKLIEAKYLKPNKKMTELVKYLKISDMFFCGPSMLAINTKYTPPETITPWLNNDIFRGEKYKRSIRAYEFIYYRDSYLEPETSDSNDHPERIKLLKKLKPATVEKFKAEYKGMMPYTSLLALIIPSIWFTAYPKKHHTPCAKLQHWLVEFSLIPGDGGSKCVGHARIDALWRDYYEQFLNQLKPIPIGN